MKIYSAFSASVEKHPENDAIKTDKQVLTYRELDRYVDTIADAITKQGLPKGKVIGVYLDSSIDYVAAVLAINKTGGLFMPLEPSQPPKRLKQIVSSVKPEFIISSERYADASDDLLDESGAINNGWSNIQHPSSRLKINHIQKWTDKAITPGDAQSLSSEINTHSSGGYLLYTSGSTGIPKAIEGSDIGLNHFIEWEVKEFNLDSTVRVSQLAPLSFDVSLRDIFVPLYAGGLLCIPSPDIKQHIPSLMEWFADNKINLIHMVPSVLRLITAELKTGSVIWKERLDDLRHILLAGEALYYRDIAEWQRVMGNKVSFVNLYGPSETTLAKVFHRIGDTDNDKKEIVPLGNPIPGARVQILKNGKDCKSGEIGEICIKTIYRSNGYYGDTELTRQKFIQSVEEDGYGDVYYKTGDLGKYAANGAILFVGRLDNQVKINGNRVELFEVESAVNRVHGIDQAVVNPSVNAVGEPELVCYYTAKNEIDELKVREFLLALLPTYMIPLYFVKMENLPLSINGKVDRKALPAPNVKKDNVEFEPCINDTERRIEAIWKDVLKINELGRNISFFSAGGSSLKAIQIISRIQKEFNVLIKLAAFFAKPKISDIAEFINQSVPSQEPKKSEIKMEANVL